MYLRGIRLIARLGRDCFTCPVLFSIKLLYRDQPGILELKTLHSSLRTLVCTRKRSGDNHFCPS